MRPSVIARVIAPLAVALLAPPLSAQDRDPPPGVDVERASLSPGQSIAFTLAQGYDHQLLRETDLSRPAPHAITIRYRVEGGQSVISVSSLTGYPVTASVLADPNGDGGYLSKGSITVPGDGTVIERRWSIPLGRVNIGSFAGGPQGGLPKPGHGG